MFPFPCRVGNCGCTAYNKAYFCLGLLTIKCVCGHPAGGAGDRAAAPTARSVCRLAPVHQKPQAHAT